MNDAGETRLDATVYAESVRKLAANIVLLKRAGQVSIKSDPPGASIKINGRNMGKAPLTKLALPVGSYKLEASAPEYTSPSTTFNVKSNGEDTVSIVLANPAHEAWKKIAGTYKGILTATAGIPAGKKANFEVEITGSHASPVVTHTKENSTQGGWLAAGGYHKCSTDPNTKSRYPITARFTEDGALTIEGKDQWSLMPVTHIDTIKFDRPGEASVATVIGKGAGMGSSFPETGTLKKTEKGASPSRATQEVEEESRPAKQKGKF